MRLWRLSALMYVVLLPCLAGTALAHGGSYRGPANGGGGPGAGGIDPTAGDKSASATRWESWWSTNKEYFLRFKDEFRARAGTTTPSAGAPADTVDPDAQEEDTGAEAESKAEREFRLRVLLHALDDESAEVRASAAIALGKLDLPDARLPLLEALTKDGSTIVRDAVVIALGLLGDPADADTLIERLRHPETPQQRRCFCAFSLGLLGGDEARTALEAYVMKGVADREREKRSGFERLASAVVGLGLCGDDESRDVLRLVMVSDRYPDALRPYVMLSMGRLQDRGAAEVLVRELVGADRSDFRRAAAVALGKLGAADDPLVVEALMGAVQHDADPITRHFAALALGQIDSLELRDALRDLLRRGDARARPFAALALAQLHDTGSLPLLRKALSRSNDSSERGALSLALGLLGDEESVEVIRSHVRPFVDPWLQGYSALALGLMDDLAARDRLWERLDDTRDTDLQTNLSLALGMLGDARLPGHLIEKATGRLNSFTPNAAMVIGLLRIRRAQPALVRCFYDERKDENQRAFCIVALGMMWDRSDKPRLSRFAIGHDHSLTLDPLREVLSIL